MCLSSLSLPPPPYLSIMAFALSRHSSHNAHAHTHPTALLSPHPFPPFFLFIVPPKKEPPTTTICTSLFHRRFCSMSSSIFWPTDTQHTHTLSLHNLSASLALCFHAYSIPLLAWLPPHPPLLLIACTFLHFFFRFVLLFSNLNFAYLPPSPCFLSYYYLILFPPTRLLPPSLSYHTPRPQHALEYDMLVNFPYLRHPCLY